MSKHRLHLILLGLVCTGLSTADTADERLQERRDASREAVEERSQRNDTRARENRRAVQERLERRDEEARQRHEAVKENAREPWQRQP